MKRLAAASAAVALACAPVNAQIMTGPSLSPTGAADLNTVTPSGGATRTLTARAGDVWTVKEYGAKCDNATDDTAAFQAAANDYAAHPDIAVVGKCRVAGGITVPGQQTWHGASQNGGTITNTSATADTFDVSGQFVRFENLYFNSSTTRTAGAYIAGTANRLFIDKIFCDTPFQCISAQGVNVGYFSNVTTFWYATPQANSTIFEIGGNGGDIRIARAYSIGPSGSGPLAAVHVTQTGALAIEDSTFERTGKGLFIDTLSGGIGASSIRVHGTYFDNQQNAGVDIYANGAPVSRLDFNQVWASSTASGSGVRMRTASGGSIKGVTFNQMQTFLNSNNGIEVDDTGASDIRIHNSQACQNTNSGYYFPASMAQFSIDGSQSGACQGLTGNKYAFTIGAGSTNFSVIGNDFTGNTNGTQMQATLSASTIIANNINYAAVLYYPNEVGFQVSEDHAISIVTASFTYDATMHNIVAGSRGTPLTAAVVATLPQCVAGIKGRTYGLKKADTSANNVTLTAATTNAQTGAADLIDGAATVALTTQYAATNVQCDGAGNWWKALQ